MHYYERNIGDYYRKAGRLNILQHGVYTLLIDACYDREQFPTLEEAIEWVWAETEEEIEAVHFVLRKFFKLNDQQQYVQNHIEEDLIAYKAFLTKQAENGKKGGRPKKAKSGNDQDSNGNGQGNNGNESDNSGLSNESQENPTETQNNPEKPNLTQTKPKPSNQEPSNQEPINTHTNAQESFLQPVQWKPNLHQLEVILKTTQFSQRASEILGLDDFEFHLGNFNAHHEQNIQLTDNQKHRKFAQWLVQEFEKQLQRIERKNTSIRKTGAVIPNRNVNDAWGEIQHYAPCTDDIELGDLI